MHNPWTGVIGFESEGNIITGALPEAHDISSDGISIVIDRASSTSDNIESMLVR